MNNKEQDDLDIFTEKWNIKNLRKNGVDWRTIILLKISPLKGIQRLAKKMGLILNEDLTIKAHDLFDQVERIDIFPYRSGARGFKIVLNRDTAIYFNQDGDKFIYDGFENGKYEKGKVTIFDHLRD